jgi:HlyD family secretion protein
MWRLLTNRRLLAVLLVIAVILAAALWPEAVEVDMTHADRGPLQVTIDEEGETRVRDRFVVSAPVAGRLQRIELEPGDPVSRGRTVLARINPAPPTLLDARERAELSASVDAARATAGQAQAERARAAATAERARSSLRRQENLAEAGAISRDELEAAEAAFRVAEEALKAADFNVARAQYDQQTLRARLQQPAGTGNAVNVVAPIDGVVLKRLHESESVVPVGEALLEVGDATQIEVVADLLSTDAVRVSPGRKVLLEQWGGGRTLEGRVRRVEPSGFMKISALGVEEQRVNVIIDFVDPKAAAQALGDGYRVEVRIVIWEDNDALRVPVGSLFRRGDDWAVFVADDGRAQAQVVTLGERNSLHAQVTHGLEAGRQVVLHPPDTLHDGERVTERGAR